MPIVLVMTLDIKSLGLQGIQRGLAGIAEKADRISRAFLPENSNDPTSDIVGMKLDEHQVRASYKILKTADELEKTALDILA